MFQDNELISLTQNEINFNKRIKYENKLNIEKIRRTPKPNSIKLSIILENKRTHELFNYCKQLNKIENNVNKITF